MITANHTLLSHLLFTTKYIKTRYTSQLLPLKINYWNFHDDANFEKRLRTCSFGYCKNTLLLNVLEIDNVHLICWNIRVLESLKKGITRIFFLALVLVAKRPLSNKTRILLIAWTFTPRPETPVLRLDRVDSILLCGFLKGSLKAAKICKKNCCRINVCVGLVFLCLCLQEEPVTYSALQSIWS